MYWLDDAHNPVLSPAGADFIAITLVVKTCFATKVTPRFDRELKGIDVT